MIEYKTASAQAGMTEFKHGDRVRVASYEGTVFSRIKKPAGHVYVGDLDSDTYGSWQPVSRITKIAKPELGPYNPDVEYPSRTLLVNVAKDVWQRQGPYWYCLSDVGSAGCENPATGPSAQVVWIPDKDQS